MLKILIDLSYNLGILIAFSIISGFLGQRWKPGKLLSLLQGLLFGCAAMIGMLNPLVLGTGLIFDGRSVMISLCALFFGPLAAFVSGSLAIILRITQGGVGTIMGVLVITASALIGVFFNWKNTKTHKEMKSKDFYIFGILVHIAMLMLTFVLPDGRGIIVFQQIGLPVILAYPLATILIGRVLAGQKARLHDLEMLHDSEEKFRSYVENAPIGIFVCDETGRYLQVNPAASFITGYSREELLEMRIPDLLPQESLGLAKDLFQLVAETGVASSEVAFQHKSGRIGIWSLESVRLSSTRFMGMVIDVTERKQMENALKESEEKHRLLIENSHDIIYLLTAKGDFTFVSPAWTTLLGHNVEEVIGQSFMKFVHPDDLPACFEFLRKVIESGQRQEGIEYRVQHVDGTWFWHTSSAVPLKDDNGIVIGFEGTARDITEQKMAEVAFQQSNQKLEAIIAASPDGIGMAGLDGNLQLMSNRLATMYGYTEDEINQLTGKNIFQFIDPLNHKKLSENIVKLLAGKGEYKINEYIAVKKDGSRFDVDVNSTVLFNSKGEPESILFVERDITQRKKAEEELKQISTRLAMATRAGGVGVWDYDLINNALSWDDQMFVLYGIEKKNFKHAYEAWLEGVHPEDKFRGDLEIQLAIQGEKEFDTEFRVTWPDESVHNIKAIATVIRDETGKPLRMIGTNWDITKQEEEARELMTAKEQAEKANKAKSEFLANMSHEIRTPLNGVIGFTDLLLDMKLEPLQKQYVKNASISAHSLLGIINDILDFSKIESGKLEINEIKCDLIELLEQTIDIVKYTAEQKELKLILKIPENIPRYVILDPVRARQILINLLNNAIKFTEKGEVELGIHFEEDDTNHQNKEYHKTGIFTFTVRDTGIGITQENQAKLFKAFSQADTTITRKFGGTGLGLVISNMLAERMGGAIRMESEIGKGSRFIFSVRKDYAVTYESHTEKETVVVIDQPENDTPIIHASDLGNFLKVKILIAEDVNINMVLVKAIIFKMLPEAQVSEAQNGLEALAKYKEEVPNIILMDIQMPEMDGYTASREIRIIEQKTGIHTPIIALTAGAVVGEKDKCLEYGMDDYLTKPIDPLTLKNILVKYLKPENGGEKLKQQTQINQIHFDIEKLKSKIAYDEDLLDNLFAKVLSSYPESIEEITLSIRENNISKVHKIAHRLKGSALSMCLPVLAEYAILIEATDDPLKLGELQLQLTAEWEIIRQIVETAHQKRS